MKILHWHPSLETGNALSDIVVALSQHQVEQGHLVTVAYVAQPPESTEGIQLQPGVRRIGWSGSWSVTIRGKCFRVMPSSWRRVLSEENYDLVHVHGMLNPDGPWSRLVPARNVVVSPHGALGRCRQPGGGPWRAYARAEWGLLRRPAWFHASAPPEADVIRSMFPEVVAYEVPNGASPRVFSAYIDGSDSGASVPIEILYLGRMDVVAKGLDLLVEAFARSIQSEAQPSTVLRLVGPDEGGGKERLRRLATRLGVASSVMFDPPIPREEVGAALSRAAVYAQVSRWEGQSLAATEALLAGLPAVLTAETGIGAHPIVGALDHISIVPLDAARIAEALSRARRHHRRLGELGRLAVPRLRQWLSWSSIAASHLRWYETILEGRGDN